jgi:hypothetical protein
MVEEAGPGRERHGEDSPPVAADVPGDPRRRFTWRRRGWSAAKPGRPSWWEVPPHGYLEVESRNAPTRPRALRGLAKAAAKAGLSWNPDRPLPVQRFVEAQERARLAFHARRELSRVTAAASQVMVVDSRLAEAEATLDQAVADRSAAARRSAPARTGTPALDGKATAGATGPRYPPGTGPSQEQPSRRRVSGPWTEAVILAVVAGGEGVLAYGVGRDLGLKTIALGLLAAAAAVGSIAAAQLAARGVDRFGAMPDGSEDPDRRRWLDVAVAGVALACGMTLAVAIGYLTARGGRSALALALLGLATAVSYAAIPDRPGARDGERSRSVAARLRQLQEHRRSRRQLRAAQAREAAAQATARRLREELALLVPQLFAAEQAALLFWRYQVAIGDAAQHAFEQHLAAFTMRRSRGAWRPIAAWWLGASPVVSDAGSGRRFASVGGEQSEWGDQVARVTMAAKRVLVRRGLLDITHALWLSRLPGASQSGNGRPAGSNADAVAGAGDRPPVVPPALDPPQPDGS